MIVLLATVAFADPISDPWQATRHQLRQAAEIDQLRGAPRSARDDLWRWDPATLAPLMPALGPALALNPSWRQPAWGLRPALGIGVGELVPSGAAGRTEPGAVDGWLPIEGVLYAGALELFISPSPSISLAPAAVGASMEWRVGLRRDGLHLGVGQQSRWFGPGRRGTLLLSDNALPAPALDLGANWRLPGRADVLGRFSAELLTGVLDQPRGDVQNPGWLLLDLRWAPLPWLEAGIERAAIFGGRGRPLDLGQLLLPTQPHVSDDPDALLPDSDERAALDLRVTLPLARWLGGGPDWLELWIQHGAEDIIQRGLLPQLAGVANQYGAELGVGPWVASGEFAILEDDRFRWYTGHRIYHDGWTQAGRPLGEPVGGDGRSLFLRLGHIDARTLSLQARGSWSRRVQVLDLLADSVFIAPIPERRRGAGLDLWRTLSSGGWWKISLDLSSVEGQDFQDRRALERRLGISLSPGWWR